VQSSENFFAAGALSIPHEKSHLLHEERARFIGVRVCWTTDASFTKKI